MKMVKSIAVLFLLLLPILVFGNPSYVELNNLAIIRGVGVSCSDSFSLYLQELIPVKEDNGITYQYHYYQEKNRVFSKAFHSLRENADKKLYLSHVHYVVTDCKKSDFIIQELNIKPDIIYHIPKDVLKKLKETKS